MVTVPDSLNMDLPKELEEKRLQNRQTVAQIPGATYRFGSAA